MNLLYLLGALLASPYLIGKALASPKWRAGLREKWGRGAARPGDAPCVWVHAVSVGEVAAAKPVVEALRGLLPGRAFAISTATLEGRRRAEALFAGDFVLYAPFDLLGCVRRTFDRVRPAALVLMELELWPNLWREALRRGLPVSVANGRMTARSFPRYRALWRVPGIGGMFRRLLASATVVAQNGDSADRFRALGADPARVSIAGNVKFDIPPGDPSRLPEAVRAWAGAGPLLVAGSTHAGEEEICAGAFVAVRGKQGADVRLALAPRHTERAPAAAAALARAGLSFARLSDVRNGVPIAKDTPALLVDTVGDLAPLYALATAAFVGGSLVPVGGHNPLEPAAAGVPVFFGPWMDNFSEQRAILRDAASAIPDPEGVCLVSPVRADPEIRDGKALGGVWYAAVMTPQFRRAIGAAFRSAVEANRGAAQRNAEVIAALLKNPVPPAQ